MKLSARARGDYPYTAQTLASFIGWLAPNGIGSVLSERSMIVRLSLFAPASSTGRSAVFTMLFRYVRRTNDRSSFGASLERPSSYPGGLEHEL